MAHTSKDMLRQAPLILALENSGLCGSIALISGSHCIAEHSQLSRLTHSKRMLSSLERLMQETETEWNEIDAIAISLGPGSFTGLRIGLSTVKGLAMASGTPLIGVSSLDGLAGQFGFTSLLICPLLDARKKEIYAAFYRSDKNGNVSRISDYLVAPPEDIIAQINEPTLFIGDGTEVYKELLHDKLGDQAIFAPPQLNFAKASSIGYLALPLWQQKHFLDPASAGPIYVRPSDAEINFNKKKKAP